MSSPTTTVLVRTAADAPLTLRPYRRRDALLARVLAWRLDHRLADGAPPEDSTLLATRAAQLVTPSARHTLARAWLALPDRAAAPASFADPRVPLPRDRVLAATADIDAVAAALTAATPVPAAAVARARGLLTDGTGPLHRGADLRDVLGRLTADLRAGELSPTG